MTPTHTHARAHTHTHTCTRTHTHANTHCAGGLWGRAGSRAAASRPAGRSVPMPTARHAGPSVRNRRNPDPVWAVCAARPGESEGARRASPPPPRPASAAPALGGSGEPDARSASSLRRRQPLRRRLRRRRRGSWLGCVAHSADGAESPQKRRPWRQAASGRLGSRRLRRKPPPAPTQAAAGSGVSTRLLCLGRARATRTRRGASDAMRGIDYQLNTSGGRLPVQYSWNADSIKATPGRSPRPAPLRLHSGTSSPAAPRWPAPLHPSRNRRPAPPRRPPLPLPLHRRSSESER